MIQEKEKIVYLKEIKQLILEMINLKTGGVSNFTTYAHIKKDSKNYGFIQKELIKYSKKFYLPHSYLLLKKDFDQIYGRAATDEEVKSRHYRTGYDLFAVIALSEIMEIVNEEIGYEVNICRKIDYRIVHLVHDNLKRQMEKLTKKG
ncbi:hypothetical protein IPC755_28540 [Pseudomonas aeruginosa]|uniref:hypothetical protein n=1 Tax=Pseudomonas aeruginosa TaxID=287 RepID=UPI000FC3FE49|nr:hypothetical protein [Pseudomonas aeruginosa]RUG38102.1 hypothetical protein IPC755_28540 [Pseudomonas aeruginosa]